MSTSSIIILAVMLLFVVASFLVLFKGEKVPNVVVVPSYDNSIKKILDSRFVNEGVRGTQKELLEKMDRVLDVFDKNEE